MSKKLIRDVTFNEFSKWANERACDGRWSMSDAITCCEVVAEVLKTKPIFGRKKAREQAWERIKAERLNLDAELEV